MPRSLSCPRRWSPRTFTFSRCRKGRWNSRHIWPDASRTSEGDCPHSFPERGLFTVRLLGAQCCAEGTKGNRIKALASHLIEGKRQETGNRRTSGHEKREQGDGVMEGGQRRPVPGNGLRSVASPTAAFLLLDPAWAVTALCLLSDC